DVQPGHGKGADRLRAFAQEPVAPRPNAIDLDAGREGRCDMAGGMGSVSRPADRQRSPVADRDGGRLGVGRRAALVVPDSVGVRVGIQPDTGHAESLGSLGSPAGCRDREVVLEFMAWIALACGNALLLEAFP